MAGFRLPDGAATLALALAVTGTASAQVAPPAEVRTLDVVATTPAPGAGVDWDKLPATVQILSARDFQRTGALNTTDALAQRIAGTSVSDTQGNGFTGELDFRGFGASPLQGSPQGLAVYMGGVRLNEAFGDTVNWDLIPQTAIARADLVTSDPAFGLNALAGAVSLTMKSGADQPGGAASLQGGSFGQVAGAVEYGWAAGPWSLYVAGDGARGDGWRRESASRVGRLYADLGWAGHRVDIHVIAAGADNRFGVAGPTPTDLLAIDRRAIFTSPQTTQNRAGLVAVSARLEAGAGWSLHAGGYLRIFSQQHVDGNDGDFESCSDDPADPLAGTLCVQADGFPPAQAPPTNALVALGPDDAPIHCPLTPAGCDGTPYGTVDQTSVSAHTRGAWLQASNSGPLLGRANAFAIGASLDHSRTRFSASSTLGVIDPALVVGFDPGVPGAGGQIHTAGALAYSPVGLVAVTDDYGIYATDTLDLGERLSITLSGRMNRADIIMSDLTGVTPSLNGRHSFQRFNPGAGLTWRPARTVTAFAGYSQANRAPTPLELGCSDPLRPCLLESALVSDPPLHQVTASTFEGGLRGRTGWAGGRLEWRVALFQTSSANDILALASPIQGRGYYANVPRTRRRGGEVQLEYRSERWLAYLGYSHVEATYQFTGSLPSPNNPGADAAGDIQVSPGNRVGGIPADRFKAGADLTLPSGLTIGGDVVAAGPQPLAGDEANQQAALAGYWTANLHASYRWGAGIELFGRIDNLFDRRYATFGTYYDPSGIAKVTPSPLPANPDPRTLTPAAPRAISFGMRASF